MRLLVVLGLALTAACGGAMGKSYPPYRYRLTVEVETPQGLRTGSSVIEVRTAMAGPNSIPSPGQVFMQVNGEAVAVDLPNGQTLFALLSSGFDGGGWAAGAYAARIPRLSEREVKARSPDGKWTAEADFDLWMEAVLASTGTYAIPRIKDQKGKTGNDWPMLVRLRDLRDPGSVEQVDPDNLAASFGKGYVMHGITVERTEDAVTRGIRKRLPWLHDTPGSLMPQPHDPKTGFPIPLDEVGLAVRLTGGDFERNPPER